MAGGAQLAESWFKRGNAELQAGNRAGAHDLQTALIYGRRNVPDEQQQMYQLDFSEALAATGHPDEARLICWICGSARPETAR